MISSALRALRILERVGRIGRPVGVTELSRQLQEVPGTVFRGLNALENEGYLQRFQSSSDYVLGATVNNLHHNVLSRFVLREFSVPYLDQIAFASGETTSFFMPVGWYSLRLAAAPGANDVTSASPIGELNILDRSCAGRAILAGWSDEKLAAYLDWRSRNGIGMPDLASLREALSTIRKQGFADEATSFAPGRASAAFAIRRGSHAIAAVAIEGPVLDLNTRDVSQWLEIVASLEASVRDCSSTIEGPFAHLDPASIDFGRPD